jgi:hypothetical protein
MSDGNKPNLSNLAVKYFAFIVISSLVIGVFSLIMAGVASFRNEIESDNYSNAGLIYNGPLEQSAPSLRELDTTSDIYLSNKYTPQVIKKFIDNTHLISTEANVTVDAEFVKKGLAYQPTYRTNFFAEYILENKLAEKSAVTFIFPFPVNADTNEISNVGLTVNGVTIQDAKTKVDLTDEYGYATQVDGLKWTGEIAANDRAVIGVGYETVGLQYFSYRGIENSKGSQDFNFTASINGTRSYNIIEGLSVDEREFGENSVLLKWNKEDLFSKPLINFSVGGRLNPSTQVSRIYLTMSPLYAIFISIIAFGAFKFARPLRMFDLFLLTVLFVVFFPFVHYLSSFTVDPTMELFSGIANVGEFSMPLYAAFGIAWLVVGGIMFYLLSRMASFKFSLKFLLPTLVLFLGFFPLVVTIPEYSMLLVIIGFIALMAIIVQVRIKLR